MQRIALRSITVLALAVPTLALAQDGYRLPPQGVVDIADAPGTPIVSFSPDGQWMLVMERDTMPSIEDLARPMLRLAGMRIDPAANGRYSTSFYHTVTLWSADGGVHQHLPLPEGTKVGSASWSHDSSHFAWTQVGARGTELWTATVETPDQPHRVSARLNTILSGFGWTPDGRALYFSEVPADRGAAPEAPRTPRGPNVQETSGNKSPLRTYQDLLSNPHEEALFEHYATSQLVVASADDDRRQPVGEPGLYGSVSMSPNGRYLLVHRTKRPFSYLMPWYSFPHTIEIWNQRGERVHQVADVPLAEGIPIGGVRLGPRNVQWKPGDPDSLVWVEALDNGDPKAEVPHRDRWMQAIGPFNRPGGELFRLTHRASGLTWLEGTRLVLARDYDRDRRWIRTLLVDLARPRAPQQVLEDRSVRDRYGDPGRILTTRNSRGYRVVQQHGDWIYRAGSGASPEGLLPFLDRQNLVTLQTERLWRCESGAYESASRVLEDDSGNYAGFVTLHESPTSPPNYQVRRPDAEPVALTAFKDPTPQIRGIKKELVKYQREDGVPLSATLYLPPDYDGGRLPLLVWAYPIEFNDPSTAGQVSSSPHRFTRLRGSSHLYLVTQGYAVMDGATMPVIGDAETMNDTFVEQIVGAAKAAIDYAVERGVADRDKVGVGGHSYGAFMTANLLAHCDLFAAGIARSGAYNRTLTPFGFQSERRTFWEAPDAYFNVSPFMHAHKINEPMLMIHGEVDNNSGTYPIQSERMFQAIKGNGGTARLVMLPNESHGYRARESVLHVLAEMTDWFDRYLKNAEPVTTTEAGAASGTGR